jgi:hypothetical protein
MRREGWVRTSKGLPISPVRLSPSRKRHHRSHCSWEHTSFSLEQLLGKEANPHPKVPCFPWGRCVELSTDSLPTGLLPPCVVFSYKRTF